MRDMSLKVQNSFQYRNIEEAIVELFERLLNQLPANTAALDTRRVGDRNEGILVTLRPHNPKSASIWAHAENGLGLVDFGFGEWGPTWELPVEGHNPRADRTELLQEVEQLCKAVMSGRCRHKRGFLTITGSIEVGNRPYRITDMLVFHPRPPLRGTRVYEPYVPEL
jgi:hypothetical protein